VGFRLRWSLTIERTREPHEAGEPTRGFERWAVVGLAALGIAAVVVWRYLGL
jgi:hypothetical protein